MVYPTAGLEDLEMLRPRHAWHTCGSMEDSSYLLLCSGMKKIVY